MKLWLLRHARVLVGADVCYGTSDVAFDLQAAETAARDFAPCPAANSILWTSPSSRAGHLASALQSHRPDLRGPRMDLRLQEMDFGHWEMQAWNDIPRPAIDAWANDFPNHRFGGKESAQDVIDRVAMALDDAWDAGIDEVVWVTHAGVIRAVKFLLAAQGRRHIASASEWPTSPVGMGAWIDVEL